MPAIAGIFCKDLVALRQNRCLIKTVPMKKILFIISVLFLINCQGNAQEKQTKKKAFKVTKTDKEWREQLSDMSYYVLRRAGTEPPFANKYHNFKGQGTYLCAGCKTPLYKSEHKYDSGTGWPSFDRAIKGNVAYDVDYKIGYARTEVHCATCGGHLGHVFDDGPKNTTGKRHCINSAALVFKPKTTKN